LAPWALLASLAIMACGGGTESAPAASAPSAANAPSSSPGTDLPISDPQTQGVALEPLVGLTSWVADNANRRIFSALLTRHGTLVYEMYTPGITRDDAHYVMSTTKSFTSAIVGAAIDHGAIPSVDASITDLLPASMFASPADSERFRRVTLHEALDMSALDANEPPRDSSPAAVARGIAFRAAPNRVAFALTHALVPTPGTTYQYNDVTPMLAGGAVQYATGKRLFDYGTETLFAPMGFKNAEWTQQDPSGLDLASYGLRLRPMDMQKFGILFLHHGRWGTEQLLSEHWIQASWAGEMNTGAGVTPGYKNYGAYWWRRSDWGTEVHLTMGWRGQFIVVIPAYDAVFSMTADIGTNDEHAVLATLMQRFVIPALTSTTPVETPPSLARELASKLAAVHQGASRVDPHGEARMVPSAAPKGAPIPFKMTAWTKAKS
jgi:CubicO group peptidase (beta-lactamase class C family)